MSTVTAQRHQRVRVRVRKARAPRQDIALRDADLDEVRKRLAIIQDFRRQMVELRMQADGCEMVATQLHESLVAYLERAYHLSDEELGPHEHWHLEEELMILRRVYDAPRAPESREDA